MVYHVLNDYSCRIRPVFQCGHTFSPLALSSDRMRSAKSLCVVKNFSEEVIMTNPEFDKYALLLIMTKICCATLPVKWSDRDQYKPVYMIEISRLIYITNS